MSSAAIFYMKQAITYIFCCKVFKAHLHEKKNNNNLFRLLLNLTNNNLFRLLQGY
jgi:hypothetical protein